jgi:RNA polymerase sigma-70 factor (ECF subfamily)
MEQKTGGESTIDISRPIIAHASPRSEYFGQREETPEKILAQRIVAGDSDALGVVYDRHAPSLLKVLVAILGSRADAEDALQEVFVKLSRSRASHVRDLRAYLMTAARHEAFSTLRRRRRERPLEDSDLEGQARLPDNDAPLTALLQRLPPEQREVIALKIYQELTFAEIAAIVKASPNTVAGRYRYGIERLRAWCREEDQDGI